jgi:ankyrin repeat protein
MSVSAQDIQEFAQKGDLEGVKTLLEKDPQLVNAKDSLGRTPLHWAARGVHFELIKYLVKKGADVNVKDNVNIVPLSSIASRGHKEAGEFLIKNGANINVEKDATGNTPLSYAVSRNQKDIVNLFISSGIKIPVHGEEARNLLHRSASAGYIEFIELMIEKGVDLNTKNYNGGNLLHSACKGGNARLMEMLIEKGMDLDEKDGYGITPVHIAAFYGHKDVLNMLIDNGADINAENKVSWRPLQFAEFNGKKEISDLLKARGANQEKPKFTGLKGEYFGQEKPGKDAKPFARGILTSITSLQSAPVFSPDGKEVYWSTFFGNPFRLIIMFMKVQDGQWSVPQIAPFSNNYFNFNPVYSPDGKKVYFISNRPVEKNGESSGFNNWYVEKTNNGWSEPKHHGETVNSNNDWGASISLEGNLYFASGREGGKGGEDIYISRKINGSYTKPVNLGDEINTKARELYPYISPDESYLIFSSTRSSGEFGGIDIHFDLYISFKKEDGSWTNAKKLKNNINTNSLENTVFVSTNGKCLFFVSQRNRPEGDIYWIDARIIDEPKLKEL